MRRTSIKMLVVLGAMLACMVVCQWISLAAPAGAGTLQLDEDPNGPDPMPPPEVAGLSSGLWSDDDPNGSDPVPPPEII